MIVLQINHSIIFFLFILSDLLAFPKYKNNKGNPHESLILNFNGLRKTIGL